MSDDESILVQVLGETDAIFWPIRSYANGWGSRAMRARKEYQEFGVEWASGAAGEIGRKRNQRGVGGLVESGLLVTRKRRGSKRLWAKLTDAGETIARRILSLPSIFDGWLSLLEVASLTKPRRVYLTDVYIPEWKLAGTKKNWEGGDDPEVRREWIAVIEMAHPALCRDWLASFSSTRGHVYYAVTPLGMELLETGTPPPEEPSSERDDEAWRLYCDRFHAGLGKLQDPEGRERDLGFIPLPVAIAGLKFAEMVRESPLKSKRG